MKQVNTRLGLFVDGYSGSFCSEGTKTDDSVLQGTHQLDNKKMS